MNAESWWTAFVAENLSQGDVIASVPVSTATNPVRYLQKRTEKGGVQSWVESDHPMADGDGRSHFLARGRLGMALVLSHDCELDKPRANGRVLLAAVAAISGLPRDQQTQVLRQENHALLPLPSVPSIGDCYADLRSLITLHRTVTDQGQRIASMTPPAIQRLYAQLVAFFLRRGLPPE